MSWNSPLNEPRMNKPSILIVDDEENLLDALKLNLELEGFEVSTAADGVQALRKVEQEYFDLIVLDVMLPEVDGITVTFTDDALDAIARFATEVNKKTENIGARRLHTVMERLLEDLLFEAPEFDQKVVEYNAELVEKRLAVAVHDLSQSNFVL